MNDYGGWWQDGKMYDHAHKFEQDMPAVPGECTYTWPDGEQCGSPREAHPPVQRLVFSESDKRYINNSDAGDGDEMEELPYGV